MGFLTDKQSNTHSKTLSASFKHPTLSKLHFPEWWILALDGRMKYSITLFSCANEAECGFRGFLFSKVACLVMHMPPSYVSFPCPCLHSRGALNGREGLIRLPASEPWPSAAQREQPWPLISRAIKPNCLARNYFFWHLLQQLHTLEIRDGWSFGGFFPSVFLCIAGCWCDSSAGSDSSACPGMGNVELLRVCHGLCNWV